MQRFSDTWGQLLETYWFGATTTNLTHSCLSIIFLYNTQPKVKYWSERPFSRHIGYMLFPVECRHWVIPGANSLKHIDWVPTLPTPLIVAFKFLAWTPSSYYKCPVGSQSRHTGVRNPPVARPNPPTYLRHELSPMFFNISIRAHRHNSSISRTPPLLPITISGTSFPLGLPGSSVRFFMWIGKDYQRNNRQAC